MTGPTPRAAARALQHLLQRAVSCVTRDILVAEASGAMTTLTLTSRLTRPTGSALTLVVLHNFAVLTDASQSRQVRWQTRTTGYIYRLDDADGREILAYHWHPHGRSHVTIPHLHLGAALCDLRAEMHHAHLRTGMVTPIALLALAIEQFDIRPRLADWAERFDRADLALADG